MFYKIERFVTNKATSLAVITLTSSVICDALRDTLSTTNFWLWHTIKWAAFYPPLILILLLLINRRLWIPFTAAAALLWQLTHHLAGGQWPSIWTSWISSIF